MTERTRNLGRYSLLDVLSCDILQGISSQEYTMHTVLDESYRAWAADSQNGPLLMTYLAALRRVGGSVPHDLKSVRQFCDGNSQLIMDYIEALSGSNDPLACTLASDLTAGGAAPFVEFEWAAKIISKAKAGDPALAAVKLYNNFASNMWPLRMPPKKSGASQTLVEWVWDVISTAVSGDPSMAAFKFSGFVGERRNKKFIQTLRRDKWGSPAEVAVKAFHNFHDFDFIAEIIEGAVSGDPSSAAFDIASATGDVKIHEWARDFIGRDKIGDAPKVAVPMVQAHIADKSWARRVIRSSSKASRFEAAKEMVREGFADKSWLKKIR